MKKRKMLIFFFTLLCLYFSCSFALSSRSNSLLRISNQSLTSCKFECLNYSSKQLKRDFSSFKEDFNKPLNSVAFLFCASNSTYNNKLSSDCTLVTTDVYEDDKKYNLMNMYSEYSDWSSIRDKAYISLEFAKKISQNPYDFKELINEKITINGKEIMIGGIYSSSINTINYGNKADYFNSIFDNPVFVSKETIQAIIDEENYSYGACFLNKKSINDNTINLLCNDFVDYKIENFGGCHDKSKTLISTFSIISKHNIAIKIISWIASLLTLCFYLFLIVKHQIRFLPNKNYFVISQGIFMLLIVLVSSLIDYFSLVPLITSGSIVFLSLLLAISIFCLFGSNKSKTIEKVENDDYCSINI